MNEYYNGPVWDIPDITESGSLKQDFTCEFPSGSEDFLDEEYDLSQDYSKCVQNSVLVVTLKNVQSGIAVIAC